MASLAQCSPNYRKKEKRKKKKKVSLEIWTKFSRRLWVDNTYKRSHLSSPPLFVAFFIHWKSSPKPKPKQTKTNGSAAMGGTEGSDPSVHGPLSSDLFHCSCSGVGCVPRGFRSVRVLRSAAEGARGGESATSSAGPARRDHRGGAQTVRWYWS